MKITILGCGPSSGVPTIIGDWGVCDPENPKNRRRRPSILVEQDDFHVLVDTSPDIMAQLLDAEARVIDAVIYTHDHADHVMGIDDLRVVRRHMGRNIGVYAEPQTMERLQMRFGYLFSGIQDPEDLYRPILDPHVIDGPMNVGPFVNILPIEQDHGICPSLGFRFGKFAYSTDVVRFPQESLEALKGIDIWIVDCLRDGGTHPTHANLDQTLAWIEEVGPKRAILTHMNFQADYETLLKSCPDGVEPAYDGMVIEF
ncbi:MAG: MBL fold metallo-hydrolase [Rhodospirillaceae bacterium]|jgi:phosphoribosyl 1,2-cyclic phosphate phosphodiesterase|nr:MBL fold metallo-hydrolase [Rhodospirillaceae bacterium]MBT5455365.1 MBL fold metallo-hydrolase [Rhodospirillaceae bacterium]